MKKLLLLVLWGFAATACTDKDYDLSKVDTDHIAVGDGTSVYKIPLATIRVGLDELSSAGAQGDIRTMFADADIWLPTRLPESAPCLYLTRLHDTTYTDALFDALFEEMDQTSSGKLDRVTDLVLRKYKAAFAAALGISDGQLTAEYFKSAYLAPQTTAIIRNEARTQALHYLNGLDDLAPLNYDLGSIDLDGDVVDMLVGNLDPEGTLPERNTLYLYGRIESVLPLSLQLIPAFSGTGIGFSAEVEPDGANDLPRVRVYEPDLRTLVAGTTVTIPIRLENYYPGRTFTEEGDQLVIRLSLEKHGSLDLDL